MNSSINTQPIDRATLWHRHHREHVNLDRQVAQIAIDNGTQLPAVHSATAGGDERRLRGIPCIARGVPGHIPGSRP